MPLKAPNLDDRNFQQLLKQAESVIRRHSPQWTDLSPSDPGIVLLEAFTHLTEVMIYRLNRLPEKAYVEFLRLMGVKLYPPSAASVNLRFSLSRASQQAVEIPRSTRVTLGRAAAGSDAPVFVMARGARIEPGDQSVDALAYHCELVEGEKVGTSSGMPGQTFTVQRPPIIAPTGDGLDLIVGVEAFPQELDERVPALQYDNKTFRIWREVDNLSEVGQDRFVYLTDRVTGMITFPPALRLPDGKGRISDHPERVTEAPATGREVRVWYWRGGGTEGNLAPNTLTVLKDPIPGVEVSNPEAATGGRPVETLENALYRGPHEIHSLKRAVTARDFEHFAELTPGVERARAFTTAALWKHAPAGTVEVLLVPYYLEENKRSNGAVTAEKLKEQETEDARLRIQEALDERRPLGTTCRVNWVRYKTVRVRAKIVVYRGEDPEAVRTRVLDRLHQTINPLPTLMRRGGWSFGEPLRPFDVYDARQEPGVHYVEDVKFLIDDVPDKNVVTIAVDAFQRHTWYAGAGETLFRTLNDGDGWEPSGVFEGEEVELVRVHPGKAGLIAVATKPPTDTSESRVRVSWDCGENWRNVCQLEFKTQDMAWLMREGVPVLLLATDKGLYELAMLPEASPVPVLVDPANQSRGFYAVSSITTIRGAVVVAVAAQSTGGVFFSDRAGRSDSFKHIGLKGEDVRVLEMQRDGIRSFLWAGVAVSGKDPERGCYRIEVEASAEGWRNFVKGWTGGSCRALAFQGAKVVAATHHSGVVWLDSNREDPSWQSPTIRCGLPFRDAKQDRIFQPVDAVAARVEDNARGEDNMILAGGVEGVYRSGDGSGYENTSSRVFTRNVTIPDTWLFCSGEHDIEVVSEDEAK